MATSSLNRACSALLYLFSWEGRGGGGRRIKNGAGKKRREVEREMGKTRTARGNKSRGNIEENRGVQGGGEMGRRREKKNRKTEILKRREIDGQGGKGKDAGERNV